MCHLMNCSFIAIATDWKENERTALVTCVRAGARCLVQFRGVARSLERARRAQPATPISTAQVLGCRGVESKREINCNCESIVNSGGHRTLVSRKYSYNSYRFFVGVFVARLLSS